MRQAKEALKFCLLGLNPGDRFNIIDYNDNVKPYRSTLMDAVKGNLDDAIEFTSNIDAGGGTNIYDALARACEMIPRAGECVGAPPRQAADILMDAIEHEQTGIRPDVEPVAADVEQDVSIQRIDARNVLEGWNVVVAATHV